VWWSGFGKVSFSGHARVARELARRVYRSTHLVTCGLGGSFEGSSRHSLALSDRSGGGEDPVFEKCSGDGRLRK
jgi:hypothetical protein